jgi:type II secretory pathway predicted ATPase ExeA
MTLVGEVGTGKTTLVATILESIGDSMITIIVRHTTIDREELLRIILHTLYANRAAKRSAALFGHSDDLGEIGARINELSRISLINEFYAFITGEFMSHQPPPLLIIDEAQNLTVDVLEEVRLLTNLEDPKSKMLQVLLVGQPELEDKLLRSDLRQLRQRIAVAARLFPLSLEETADYIEFRLQRGGCRRSKVFLKSAVETIWSASQGSPRTINVLCDHALVHAFAMGKSEVDAPAARDAVQDVLCLSIRETPLRKPGPYLVSRVDTAGREEGARGPGVKGGDERRDRVG